MTKLIRRLRNWANSNQGVITLAVGLIALGGAAVGGFLTSLLDSAKHVDRPAFYWLFGAVVLLAFGFSLLGAKALTVKYADAFASDQNPPLTYAELHGSLFNHRLTVLTQQLDRLHFLFTSARDADDDESRLSPLEQIYQLQDEPIIKLELVDHVDLYRLYFDDTGFTQTAYEGSQRKVRLTQFFERRHARLKEVIARLRELASGGVS